MNKRLFLKNTSLLIALVIVVYLVANYTGTIKNEILKMLEIPGSSVKGASTQRAEELSQKIGGDVASQFGILEEQILNVRLVDAINGLTRLQKIPRDMHSIQQYLNEQVQDVLKSRK